LSVETPDEARARNRRGSSVGRYRAWHFEQYSETGWIEMKYFVIYEKTYTGFSAYAPDLPGCVATGPTLEETKTTMREAIEFHLDGMRADGTPIPLPSTLAAEEIAG
jgi:predicted RNase H-like HicB family nuclease